MKLFCTYFYTIISIFKRHFFLHLFLFIGFLCFILSGLGLFSIPCPIHLVFGIWCPGCGITRMIHSLLSFHFYQAFRYNSFLFLSIPFFLFFFLNAMICVYTNQVPFFYRIPRWIYYSYIILLFLFMILRNLFPFFAPIDI